MTVTQNGKGTAIGESVTNAAEFHIESERPYIATIGIEGNAAIMFNRWSNEDVAAKAKAPKGSAAKKTDNVAAKVYRCPDGTIGIPGEYLRGSIVTAGGRFRDPSSTGRKSAKDLLKAGIVPLTELASLGKADWDYLDQRRVMVQRNAVTRIRPAFLAGWRAEFEVLVNVPEYIAPAVLLEIVTKAGLLVGLGDFRPTYGRFQVVRFDVSQG